MSLYPRNRVYHNIQYRSASRFGASNGRCIGIPGLARVEAFDLSLNLFGHANETLIAANASDQLAENKQHQSESSELIEADSYPSLSQLWTRKDVA